MANIFTKAIGSLTRTNKHTYSMRSHDTTFLKMVGTYFGFDFGKHSLKRYQEAYAKNALVYMIVNRIATSTAAIDRVIVNDDGEPVDNSFIAEQLNAPNDQQSLIDFYEELYEYLLLTGNVFIKRTASIGGLGYSYEVVVSSEVEINADATGKPISYDYTRPDGRILKGIPAEDILHIKTSNVVNVDNTDILYGLSPLQAAWVIVMSSQEKLKADAAIFKNRGIVGILTNATDNAMLPKERERLQKEFDDEVGGSDKYNKIKVSTARLQYIQTGMSPTDLKLLEGVMQSLRMLCNIYGISSILFNDNENSTYNNVVEAKRAAYTDAFLPLAEKVDIKLSEWLNTFSDTDAEYITADLTSIELIKGNTNEVANALNNLSPLLANKVLEAMTMDEVRGIAGLSELPDGLGEGLSGEGSQNINVNTDA
jgi:HK97 family phage portal protein